ncbi:hypothetical protein [Fischerella sp. PCC 9605]|uniref:hypothetical protein n=1 Tax=Fischerella sp. PCC 9605 TaxID=1173024 RepID=UPI0004B37ADD|nr:hypothetical protein [Fischerella sp. PCC 9605]
MLQIYSRSNKGAIAVCLISAYTYKPSNHSDRSASEVDQLAPHHKSIAPVTSNPDKSGQPFI